MPECDVIIVNYNTGALLAECVDSVLKSLQDVKVFVIDNDSHDDSMNSIPEDLRVEKVYRNENHGFAKSCNHGAALGNSEYLLILNPDCMVKPETVQGLKESFGEHKNLAMMGCWVCDPDGREQRATRRRLPTIWRTLMTVSRFEKIAGSLPFLAGVNLTHQPIPEEMVKVEAVSGALMLFKRKAFEEVGGFDEKFPMHFEDLDIMKRMNDKGFEIGLNPDLNVIHYQGTSSKSNPRVQAMKRQGLVRYLYKHGSFLTSLFAKCFLKK